MFRSGICLFLFVLLSVSVALAGIPPAYAQTAPAEPTPSPTPLPAEPAEPEEEIVGDYVPGQLLIRFKPGVSREQISDFYAEYGLSERDNLDRDPSDGDEELKLAAVQLSISASLINLLEADERVLYAEPNYLLHLDATPNDPDYGRLWGLNNTGQTGGTTNADINGPETWALNTGSANVIVAVIDTGVDYRHEDLAANMWKNPGECPNGVCTPNGIDDDNNGYIDDFHGINAVNNTGDPMDDFGHGTHVAGTIGAVGNNGVGVVGVNWNVQIVACKFLSATGSGTVASAVKCFQYIHQLRNEQKQNIVLTNNSWGGAVASEALRDAMAGPGQPLHICAAGNSNSSNPHFPAAYELPNIISVAATDHNDQYASFSNHGAAWVDLAAPGVDILSTVPRASCPLCSPTGYDTASGTSMATPHIAGGAALLYAQFPTLTQEQVHQRLLAAIDPLTDRSKLTLTNGRLNLFNAFDDDLTPPAAVNDLRASGLLLTKIQLAWTASGDDERRGVATAYDLRYATTPLSAANWDQATPVEGTPSPQPAGSSEQFTVGGLEPDTTYYFGLKVLDNVGNASDISNVVMAKTSNGTIVFADDMENGAEKWTLSSPDTLWHLSSLRANSPVTAWYYGQEQSRNYDTGTPNAGGISTLPIDVTGADDARLTFYEWSQVQTSARLDRTQVQVSSDGQSWQTVFESHGTEEAWVQRTVDLSPYITATGSIQIRFWFDTVDATANNFEGWYVDDVELRTANLEIPGEQRPSANLVMHASNLLFNPPNPQVGDQVTLHATVLNNGTSDANEVVVQFMEVTDNGLLPIGQGNQATQTIANIPAGGSGSAEVVYTLPATVAERTLQVMVDPNNFVLESNETDNVAQKLLTIRPMAAANLSIKPANIGFEPPTPDPGEQVTLRATINNTGTVEARSVTVQFNDATGTTTQPIGEPQVIDVIPPGGSSVVETTFDTAGLALGARDIEVVVDLANTIPETNERDNRAEKPLRLSPTLAPNLNIQGANIGFDPVAPTAGEVVTIYATILNDGSASADEVAVQFMETIGSSATPIGAQQVIPSIPAGGSGIVQISFDTSNKAGDRKIDVVVDPNNFIAEIRETDNRAQKTLSVTPPAAPNLVALASNVNVSPLTPVEGEPVTIYATILNNGVTTATDVAVQFIDATGGENLPIGELQIIPSIPAGSSGQASVTLETADRVGDRALQIVVDPSNQIQESDETDNTARSGLRIAPPAAPNLVLLASNIEFHPPQPNDGETVTIHAVVLNNGPVAARNVLVQFNDLTGGGPVPIVPEQYIDLIPPGGSGSAEATLDLRASAGLPQRDRRLQVLVDSNNLITETNEGDNSALKVLPVTASPAPNLTMLSSNIGFNPPGPTSGETVTVTAIVLNTGAADARNVVVQVVDITDGRPLPIEREQVIDFIPVGGSGMVQVLLTTGESRGDRQIRVIVDPNNLIAETNETDNRNTATLTITRPPTANLMIQPSNIGFSPPMPREGERVTVTATILNSGLITASAVLVQFVDVTDGGFEPIGEKQTIPTIAAGSSATTAVIYETHLRTGDRKIQVLVDPHTTIPESNEADNTATQTLVVAPPQAANLVILEGNVGFQPRPEGMRPSAGEVVSITATILNNGSLPAQGVTVQFLDITTNGSVVPLGPTQTIETIAPGESATARATYDTTDKSGDRRIQVVVDGGNLIRESNETDNAVRKTLKVAPPAAPNLLIQMANIGFDPPQPNPGDQVTIYATVINDGNAPADEVIVQFVDMTVTGASSPIGQPQSIASIPPGGSGTVQITYDTTNLLGDRKIQVIVDPNNFIREIRETDNSIQKTLSLVPQSAPNLVILSSNIGFDPSDPVDGETVTVLATIFNDGNAPASNVIVQFVDATNTPALPIGEPQTIDTIPVGGSGIAQVRYETTGTESTARTRRIQVLVDVNNFIAETRETDNTATRSLTLHASPAPNLVALAENIGFNPPNPVAGEQVLVHAVILNTGARSASDVVVQLMDTTGGTALPVGAPQVIGVIPPGQSGTTQIPFDTRGKVGTRQLEIVVDPNNFVAEQDETDNRASATLRVDPAPAPNLKVLPGNFKFTPPAPEQGNLVTVTVTIINDGSADADDVMVEFSDLTSGERRPIGTERTIDLIPAGSSATLTFFYNNTDEPGERELEVVVDPGNTIAEADENDNRATQTLVITPPIVPNLVVRTADLLFSPTTPIAGDPVTITVAVHNEGTGEANHVAVHLLDLTAGLGELIGEPKTFASLAAGASETFTVTYDTSEKSGERRIQLLVDPENLVAETNEGDNEVTKTLRVLSEDERPEPQANLAVAPDSFSFSPITPTVGSPVTVTVVISNNGEAAAVDAVVELVDTTDDEAEVIGRQMITGTLAAGRTGRVRFIYDTTDRLGVRTLQATADPDNVIPESDEEDNQASSTITVTESTGEAPPSTMPPASAPVTPTTAVTSQADLLAQPNLVVAAEDVAIFRPDYVAVAAATNDLVTFAATVHNRGLVDAGNVEVEFVVMTNQGWQVLGRQPLGLVAAGQSATAELTVDAASAAAYRELRVVVDPQNAIFEMDEADNRTSKVIDLALTQ